MILQYNYCGIVLLTKWADDAETGVCADLPDQLPRPDGCVGMGLPGHRVVGSIADQLLKPGAKSQVQQILNDFDSRDIDLRKPRLARLCKKHRAHDDGRFH